MKRNSDEPAAVWVDVETLTPWSQNPRKNERAIPEVMASIRRFGFGAPILARREDGEIIAGHTRVEAARRLGQDRVPVRYMDLDPADAHLLAIADNKVGEIAEWDTEALASVLRDLDVGEATEGLGFDEDELRDLLGEIGDDVPDFGPGTEDSGLSDRYTQKIDPPVYEPHGPCPPVADLMDTGKTDELVQEIEAADLPDDVRRFLLSAAQRHTVFEFRRIAEFYAHADAPLQRLMERSALVVIDFDDAIANGFVKVTKRLGAIASGEPSDVA